jgi:polyisoprenoid-binding protein YceI
MEALADRECWKIDTDRSSLTFKLRHALRGQIRGRFRCWGGHIWLAPDDAARAEVHVWAELSSLDTGSRARDDAILSTELFDIQWEPAIVFDSERVEPAEGGAAVVLGWLSLHSIRKPIAVTIEATPLASGGSDGPRFSGNARATLDRHAFGLRRERRPRDWLSERLVDETIEVTAHIEAVRARPNPRPGAQEASARPLARVPVPARSRRPSMPWETRPPGPGPGASTSA